MHAVPTERSQVIPLHLRNNLSDHCQVSVMRLKSHLIESLRCWEIRETVGHPTLALPAMDQVPRWIREADPPDGVDEPR